MNNIKQLAVIGAGVAIASKFYFKHETKAALILGVVALVAAGLADNIAPNTPAA